MLVSSCFLLVTQGQVWAQNDADGSGAEDDNAIEEVVVTARYREESLQDVPISETAFTAQTIKDANINRVGDFIALTPNMTIAESESIGASFLTIRGLTQVRNGDAPVAVVIDGVQMTNSRNFRQELFDIETIEVLRGPQGALYGRNAAGGAIIIQTKQPTDETSGYVRGGFGKSNEYLLEGSVSGPVSDNTFYRLSARYVDRNGYLTNINLNQDPDPFEDFSVRGLLKFKPSDNFAADFRFNYSETNGGALNFVFQPTIFAADGVSFGGFDFSKADANDTSTPITATNIGIDERTIGEASLKMVWDTDFASITTILAYNDAEQWTGADQFPYTASLTLFGVIDGTQTQYVDQNSSSAEIRIANSGDDRLRWMGGLYYLTTNRFISTTTGDDRGMGIARVKRNPLFNDAANPTSSFLADDNDNTAWAVFANVAYDITDKLEGYVGIRYDEDQRKQFVAPQSTGGAPGAVNQATFSETQPKFSLTYAVNDQAIVYGSWGRGFRSGQFNQNGVGEAAAAAGIAGVQDSVPAEVTETFEIGAKTQWANGRLRINGALFSSDVENQQYFVFIGQVGAQVLVPINRVDLVGGEVEVSASLTDGLDAYFAYGFTDSEIKQYNLNPGDVGNWAPYVPKSTINIGGQYRAPITDSLGIFARADYEIRGKQFWDPENSTARSSIKLLNLRLGIEDTAGTWSVTASVQNATDEKYNSEWVLGGFAHRANPRTWLVDVRYNF